MKLEPRFKSVLLILTSLALVVWLVFLLISKFWVFTEPAETYDTNYTGVAYLKEENIKEFPLTDLQIFDKEYNFKVLSIEGGSIKSIPSEVGQFTSLVNIKITDSALEKIPPEIGTLVNLETLDLTGNDLSSLPTEIGQLRKLKKLYLTGNPIDPEGRIRIQELLPNTENSF